MPKKVAIVLTDENLELLEYLEKFHNKNATKSINEALEIAFKNLSSNVQKYQETIQQLKNEFNYKTTSKNINKSTSRLIDKNIINYSKLRLIDNKADLELYKNKILWLSSQNLKNQQDKFDLKKGIKAKNKINAITGTANKTIQYAFIDQGSKD